MRSRLWPVPALAVVAAVLVGVGLPELDAEIDKHLSPTLAGYLFGGSADAAHEVLGTIATSLITVTSLTFSLTLVTLQLASSQYSPRLLRTFAADPFVQGTLALFLATFAYALTVLRTVRNDNEGSGSFVPQISVTLAYLLAITSVLALVLFLGHLVRQIRIETLLHHVSEDVAKTVRRTLQPLDEGDDEEVAVNPSPPAHASSVTAKASGFLVEVDDNALVAAAIDAGAMVWIDRSVGENVVAGVPVAFYWAVEAGHSLAPGHADRLRKCIAKALHIGVERTAAQDVTYGLRQMTDVAIRALSPGINDPTTAIHALNACAAALCDLMGYRLGTQIRCDENDVTRVVLVQPDLAYLLDLVCNQPRLYGAQDPQVVHALLALLRAVGWVARLPEQRLEIDLRCQRLQRSIAEQKFDTSERDDLERATRLVREALSQRWRPSL